MLEIIATIDGQELLIDRLFRGSVINSRSFLLADTIDVSLRCSTPVTLFYLGIDQLQRIRMKSSTLNKEIEKIESDMIGKDNPFSVDYIKSVIVVPHGSTRGEQERREALSVKFKNAGKSHLIINNSDASCD